MDKELDRKDREHQRRMKELDEESEREEGRKDEEHRREERRKDEEHRRWMNRSREEHIKYVRPDVSIPEEFFEAEDQEELKVTSPLKISEVLDTSPPVQKVICFSALVPVPQKTVITPIATVPIQQVSLVHSSTLSPISISNTCLLQ